jgi:hypothetical protein
MGLWIAIDISEMTKAYILYILLANKDFLKNV